MAHLAQTRPALAQSILDGTRDGNPFEDPQDPQFGIVPDPPEEIPTEIPRERQRAPEYRREPQGGPESPREAQRDP